MKRASFIASLVAGAFFSGCVLEVNDDPHGGWNETEGQWGPRGSSTGSPPDGAGYREDAGRDPGTRTPDAPVTTSETDAAVTPPAREAGMSPTSPDSGMTPTTGDPEAICRHDGQCRKGRCVAGACQLPCDTDETCGTGHVCTDGLCRPSTQPGDGCVYASDCGSNATCVNGFCHERCEDGNGCSRPADRCDRGLCRPDVRPIPQCTATSQCPADRTCVDAVCRNPCRDDSQCGPDCSGTVCSGGYCFMPEELLPPPCMPPPPACGGSREGCPRSCPGS
jgi:hypothetical protein